MSTFPRRAARPRPEDGDDLGLGGLLPPPPVPGLDRDRELLLKEALMNQASHESAPRPAARRRRLVWVAVPTAVCALAVGGIVAVNAGGSSGTDEPQAVVTGPVASDAVRLLDLIAVAAGKTPQPSVRADQFLYVESKVAYAGQSAAGGPATTAPAHTRQVWLSADGSQAGLIREDGQPDSTVGGATPPVYAIESRGAAPKPSSAGPNPPSVTNPTHVFVAALPTDPDALLKLIRDETRGQGTDADQRAFTAIGELLAETWAPPQVSAALYQAAARIPGVTVVPSATDAAGREGIAVARSAQGRQTQWIFDRATHTFLGERTVLTETSDAGPAGTVLGSSAVLAKAAADRAGEAPKARTT